MESYNAAAAVCTETITPSLLQYSTPPNQYQRQPGRVQMRSVLLLVVQRDCLTLSAEAAKLSSEPSLYVQIANRGEDLQKLRSPLVDTQTLLTS